VPEASSSPDETTEPPSEGAVTDQKTDADASTAVADATAGETE
jgi:hypothetical protein